MDNDPCDCAGMEFFIFTDTNEEFASIPVKCRKCRREFSLNEDDHSDD